jgi:hypothetical protein
VAEGEKTIANNRAAFHEYFILDRIEAGLELLGTEVKSLRAGKVNIKDGFIRIENRQAFLENVHIQPWEAGNRQNHEPTRSRRLLMHRSEIVEPLTNYFTGRVKRDLRDGNTTVGVGLTAANRDLTEPALVPLFRRAAYVGGVDWNHAWSNQTWAFDGDVAVSQNLGSAQAIDALQTSPARYFQRPDKVNFRRDPTKTSLTGYVAEMTFTKLSGLHWTGSVSYQEYNPSFEINESGFLGSTDMRSVSPLMTRI